MQDAVVPGVASVAGRRPAGGMEMPFVRRRRQAFTAGRELCAELWSKQVPDLFAVAISEQGHLGDGSFPQIHCESFVSTLSMWSFYRCYYHCCCYIIITSIIIIIIILFNCFV